MEFFNPEQHIGNQEIFHLCLAIVKNFGSPVRMLTLARVGMLKNTPAVKPPQPVGVRGKMGRYPIQDHADLIFVEFIHKIHEVLRFSVA